MNEKLKVLLAFLEDRKDILTEYLNVPMMNELEKASVNGQIKELDNSIWAVKEVIGAQ